MRNSTLIALISTFLIACSASKVPDMTLEESKHIEELTAKMTTRCIGRYLIDLPEAFVLGLNPEAEIDGVTISVRPMGREMFEIVLKDRETELKNMHMDGRPSMHYLRRIEPSSSIQVGRVFNRAEESGSAGIGRILELLAWKNGYALKMQVEATDYHGAGFSRPDDPPDDTHQKLIKLINIYERVRGLPVGEIPSEPGLCIPNGFVGGHAVEKEGVSIAFDLKGTPDVYFQFGEHGDLHEKNTLLERTSQTEKEMKISGTQTVRKGKQTFHNLPYEEWLMKGPTPDRVPGTMFMLHGNEVAEGADKPFITLELFNGFRVMSPPDLSDEQKERLGLYKELERASLSEAEAVALWDKIIPTFRPRPGAF